ncbi:MAG: NAD(P)/FAD-dependent oxidoreductase [Clostridia bacterium]|nr:NAD(P)/FAD-dependent oxidoreductase [Clostridia bacterium]
MNKYIVAVVGGGAAGMMAAISALSSGADVVLFEPNKMLGKKLRITGKGRCNVTNNCEPAELMQNITRNGKFMYSSVNRFKPSDVISFFEDAVVPLKTERGRRVFPQSDRAADVVWALEKKLNELGCHIVKDRIKNIKTEDGRVRSVCSESEEYSCGAVILATGGVSYTGTGSTGDGHRMARELGLDVTELKPSLVPVVTKDKTEEMMGLTLKNVTLTVSRGEKKVYSEMGEMLFTHFGVSGPLVLSASAHMQTGSVRDYKMEIDLKPALSQSELDKRVLSDFEKYSARDFVNALGDLLPKKLIPSVIRKSGIPERIKVSSVTKEMRERLVQTLKAYALTPISFRPIEEAIVTCGGVSVKEIDPKTMMSKKINGLFVAGELLDLDAYTGGYNLQIAWSTGKIAGEAAAVAAMQEN